MTAPTGVDIELLPTTMKQAKVAILTVWPGASFTVDDSPAYGPMLIAYKNAEAEATWDKLGWNEEHADEQVMVMWSLDGRVWLVVETEEHPVVDALRGPPAPQDGITCTTTVKDAKGNVVSKRVVET
jgi:hypothetical protein